MAATAELLVVDASVATKWHLPDEADADIALALLTATCVVRSSSSRPSTFARKFPRRLPLPPA